MTEFKQLLTENEAAEALRISARTLQSWRVSGGGPRFLKIGSAVRYDRTELDKWLDGRSAASTSAATGRHLNASSRARALG